MLSEWQPDGLHNQDMLSATLLRGFIDAFGSTNVVELWCHGQYRGDKKFLCEWPVFLASTAYYGRPESANADGPYDAYVVNIRFLTNAVSSGLCSEHEHKAILSSVDPARTILFDGSDDPSSRDDYTDFFGGQSPRMLVRRPSSIAGGFLLSMDCHISVPIEHIWRMKSLYAGPAPWKPTIFAGWNDNNVFRRELMAAIAASNLPNKELWWGSASKFPINGTTGPKGPPLYYHTMSNAKISISCRGGNRDCLRTSEILACGSLLVTDDPGWESLVDGENCLMFSTPEECIAKCWWALDNPEKAAEIAAAGHRLYLEQESPSHQAVRILRKAGLA